MKASACGWGTAVCPLPLARVCGDCRWRYQGLNLLGYVESASHLLILDALTTGWNLERCEPMPENAFRLSQREENEPASEQFLRSVGAADIRGHLPAHIALVGLQPASSTTTAVA